MCNELFVAFIDVQQMIKMSATVWMVERIQAIISIAAAIVAAGITIGTIKAFIINAGGRRWVLGHNCCYWLVLERLVQAAIF
jgi:hypothetical protein